VRGSKRHRCVFLHEAAEPGEDGPWWTGMGREAGALLSPLRSSSPWCNASRWSLLFFFFFFLGLLSLLSLHRLSFELSKWQGWKPAFVTKFPTFFQPPTSPPHAPQWNPLRGALRVGHHASSRSQERCHHRSAGKVRFGPRGRSGGQEVSNPGCLLMAPVQRRAMVLVHDTLPALPSPPPWQGCRSFQPPRLPA